MEMIRVISRAMVAVGYDKDRQHLYIQFKQGGQIYSYCRVPQSIHQALMSAISKGRYYDDFIKDKFDC
jgi:hypothetical protein